MKPRIGSLFSGYGGLDMGVEAVIGGEVAWHVEFDKAPSAILNHHWPDIPNYGDIRSVDWSSIPPVDVLTGGFPCQDVSLAGRRAGLTSGTRSGLWSEYARAIDVLQPSLVVIENVRGLLSAEASGSVEPDPWGLGDGATRPVINALGVVLGDLASLGYDARWCGLRAADAGAPHGRFRVFIVARPANADRDGIEGVKRLLDGGHDAHGRRRADRAGDPGEPAAPSADAGSCGREWRSNQRRAGWDSAVGSETIGDARNSLASRSSADADHNPTRRRLASGRSVGRWTEPTQRDRAAADASGARFGEHTGESSPEEARALGGDVAAGDGRPRPDRDWGPYRPAVDRWERAIGRVAPAPTNPDGRNGTHRLAPVFVEWMMGLPEGHVTSAPISRADQLKALGNGVVPQQAALALRHLLTPYEAWRVAA